MKCEKMAGRESRVRGWVVMLLLQKGGHSKHLANWCSSQLTSLVFKCTGNLRDIMTLICDVTWALFPFEGCRWYWLLLGRGELQMDQ